MGIVTYNRLRTVFEKETIQTTLYSVNNYIEESFSDIIIGCIKTDNRFLLETGDTYDLDGDNKSKSKILDKIKSICSTVWESIVSIFNKIKSFFSDMIAGFKLRKLNDKYKKFINEIPEAAYADVVRKNISEYYNTTAFIVDINGMASGSGKNNVKDGWYELSQRSKERVTLTGEDVVRFVNKKHFLDFAFGGFKKEFDDIKKKFKDVENAFRKIQKSGTDAKTFAGKYDGTPGVNDIVFSITDVKESLKYINTYSADYSKMMIHNAKSLAKVAKNIEKGYDKVQAGSSLKQLTMA